MAEPDLSLVPTNDLVAELHRRYDAILIVRETNPTDDSAETLFDFAGGVSRAIGLAARAQRRLLGIAESGINPAEAE